jgi:hypothetical protein
MTRHLFPDEFFCLRCGVIISGAYELSGVRNRNHCPYCLWSRHLDWRAPGDRLASCKGAMRPIGLTLKNARNKYAAGPSGELMIIHHCTVCRTVSINRIAADDGTEILVDVFRSSRGMEHSIRTGLENGGIRILDRTDWDLVSRRLFGEFQPEEAFLQAAG